MYSFIANKGSDRTVHFSRLSCKDSAGTEAEGGAAAINMLILQIFVLHRHILFCAGVCLCFGVFGAYLLNL